MSSLRRSIKNVSKLVNPVSALLYYPYSIVNACSRFARIPVLMYHKVIRSFMPGQFINYTVTQLTFDRQMGYLSYHGYNPITIDEYIDCLYNDKPWPRKSVLITFDDGYSGVRRIAYPILKKYGFPATLFASCNFLGSEELFPYDKHLAQECGELRQDLTPLSWEETREMLDIVAVGSHTMSHVLLAPLSDDDIRYEIGESKRVLEKELGTEVVSFSYPGGLRQHRAFDSRTRGILQECGYKIAFNSEIGRNAVSSDPYLQGRIVVEDGDSDSILRSKLAGSYDWARFPQWIFHLMYDSPANKQRSGAQSA